VAMVLPNADLQVTHVATPYFRFRDCELVGVSNVAHLPQLLGMIGSCTKLSEGKEAAFILPLSQTRSTQLCARYLCAATNPAGSKSLSF
jgi:hypothetical protein